MGIALHVEKVVSALFKATSCIRSMLATIVHANVEVPLQHFLARSGSKARLTSAALNALREESTACTSASFKAGTCSCTLKALEKPMSSMIAGAEDVPACRVPRLRGQCAALLAVHA